MFPKFRGNRDGNSCILISTHNRSFHDYRDKLTKTCHDSRVNDHIDFFHEDRDKRDMAGHDGYTRYTVRIPDETYKRLKEAAGHKSLNAEILDRLEKSLKTDEEDLLASDASSEIQTLQNSAKRLEKLIKKYGLE